MVKVCVLYPNKSGSRFDTDYYLNEQLQNYIPNYTDIEPILQFSNLSEFAATPA